MEYAVQAAAGLPENMQASKGVGADPDLSKRFADLVASEPLRQNFYVDTPAAQRSGNALTSVMSQFDGMKFAVEKAEMYASAPLSPEAEQFAAASREAIAAQAEIVRTVMMMEVMNSAKQGVTTLFQQQG